MQASPATIVNFSLHASAKRRHAWAVTQTEALGLAAFLNSRWVEHYFRVSSGNTQVSATELRNLPLPSLDKIRRIGERLLEADGVSKVALMNQIVREELNLPSDAPNGNGGHMPKLEEAKDLLNALDVIGNSA